MRKPMEEKTELCDKILDLIRALDCPQLIRLREISIVVETDVTDTYGDIISIIFATIYKEENSVGAIDFPSYGDTRFVEYVKCVETIPLLQHILNLLESRFSIKI